MKTIITVIITVLFLSKAEAQLFHPKDSIRQQAIMQVGVGGYMGTHSFIPTTLGFTFRNEPGYDQGLLLKFKVNIYKGLCVSTDVRYIKRSAMVDLTNHVLTEHFYMTMSGIQAPCMLTYTFKTKKQSEILAISAGIAFNQMNYKLSSDFYDRNVLSWATTNPIEQLNGAKHKDYSFLVGLSKTFALTSRLQLLVFNEYEFKKDRLILNNYFYNSTTSQSEKYLSSFNSFSMKIGICIIY